VIVDAPHTRSLIMRAMISCSTFVWLALLLLPVRWWLGRSTRAGKTPDTPMPPP
jgi:hypothetical protein